jgi:hypothetical protein
MDYEDNLPITRFLFEYRKKNIELSVLKLLMPDLSILGQDLKKLVRGFSLVKVI